MKRMIFGLMINSICISSWAACSYDFDATNTEIQQMIGNPIPLAKKFPYLNGATASFLLENSSYQYHASTSSFAQSYKNYINGTNNTILGDKNLSSTGMYAVELKIDNFADIPIGSHSGNQSGVYTLGYNFYGIKNGNLKYGGFVWLTNSDDTKTKKVYVSFSDLGAGINYEKEFDIAYSSANNYKIGLYLDQDSKQIGINLNGIDKGYINNTPLSDSATQISFQMFGLVGGYPTSLIGTYQPTETLIFERSQMTLNYSSNTKGICENTI